MSIKTIGITAALLVCGGLAACSSSPKEEPAAATEQEVQSAPASAYAEALEAMLGYDYEGCIKLATKTLETAGPSVEGLTLRGISYAKIGKAHLAFQDLIEVTKMDYGVTSLVNLGNAMRSLGYCARAIDAYEHALALDPGNPYILVNMTSAYFCIDDMDSANAAFVKAMPNMPKDAVSYTNAAAIKLDEGDPDQAKLVAEQAIAIDPEYFQAYKILMRVYQNQGNDAAAKEAEYQYNSHKGKVARLRDARGY